MRGIVIAAFVAATLAAAAAPASDGIGFGAAPRATGAAGFELVQDRGSGAYGEHGERRETRAPEYSAPRELRDRRDTKPPRAAKGSNCNQVCAASDANGNCASFRRVCD
jgi:hypothetical protein